MPLVQVQCANCGVTFSVIPSRIAHGRAKNCSPACQYASKAKAPKLERISFSCIGCGKGIDLLPCRTKSRKGAGKFCTRACRDENRIGSNVPNWFGGAEAYRGPNWQSQRRAARSRDAFTCQSEGCGAVGTDVHHVKPYRLFFGDWRSANKLTNLITLCRTCHRTVESALQYTEKLSDAEVAPAQYASLAQGA